jgi:hypothetical protein
MRYFETKLHSFAKLMMFFAVVVMNFPDYKVRPKGGRLITITVYPVL